MDSNTWTYHGGLDTITTAIVRYDVEASDGHIGKKRSLPAGVVTETRTRSSIPQIGMPDGRRTPVASSRATCDPSGGDLIGHGRP